MWIRIECFNTTFDTQRFEIFSAFILLRTNDCPNKSLPVESWYRAKKSSTIFARRSRIELRFCKADVCPIYIKKSCHIIIIQSFVKMCHETLFAPKRGSNEMKNAAYKVMSFGFRGFELVLHNCTRWRHLVNLFVDLIYRELQQRPLLKPYK